ncbi:unnamed protein product, partial [Allacma fusca]
EVGSISGVDEGVDKPLTRGG